MRYFLAIDAGGTKTDAVVFDETGHILCRDVSAGNNGMDIGKDLAVERLLTVLNRVSAAAPEKFAAIYGGIAGVMPLGDFYSPVVVPRMYGESVRFDDDGPSMISSTIGHRDGCGMVCGTGSSCFIRIDGQPLRKVGGKGYLIDTGGSGFEIGQEAIKLAMRSLDGRIGPTVLTELLEKRIGQKLDCKAVPVVHHGGRPYIASFAPLVFQGRKLGDAVCEEIFQRQSGLLADLTHAAARFFEGEFPVVIGGGIAAHFPEYVEAIRQKAHPRARLMLQSAPPVYGAAVEAMWDAGIEIAPDFKKNFLTDYARLSGENLYL